jgi:hypothetical protein
MREHLSQDELVTVYYGEAEWPEHLRECVPCRQEYDRLELLLDHLRRIPVPERDAGFGDQVWNAIETRWRQDWLRLTKPPQTDIHTGPRPLQSHDPA